MTFVNYKNSNNASSNLIADISASATVILITSGDEALFPTSFPFLLTIEKVNSDGNVIAREIVKATAGNQNSFTVVRGAGTCVQDDTASQRIQGSASHSFSAGDRISLYRTAEQVKDIQDDLNSKLSIAEYQSGNYVYGASTTGNDDYAITLPYPPTAYSIGQVFRFLAGTGNTGPATLNVNGLGAVAIKKNHDIPLDTGDIEAGQIVEVAYDGTNFQMNSQTATIVDMKDIKTTSFSGLKAGQELHEGDVVQIANHFDSSVATETTSLGGATAVKGGIGFTANGKAIQNLQIKAGIVEGTTPTAITVKLETDDNGKPSGTALGTVDIVNSFSSNIDINSITDGSKDYYGSSDSSYIGGGNLGKTRCFYRKSSVTGSISASGSLALTRYLINADSSDVSAVEYNILASAFLNALSLSGSHTYIIIYVDQDFKFMFVYEDSTNKIHKFYFNAPAGGGDIRSLELAGSRSLSNVGITTLTGKTQLAFSDDGMFVYALSITHTSSTGVLNAYSLTAPYDLTGATSIGDSWSVGTNATGCAYISLGNGKRYIVAGYNNNGYILAREINSDGTIGSLSITIRSGANAGWGESFSVRNYANGGASLCVPWFSSSSSKASMMYELGTAFISQPSLIDFSFTNPITPTAGQKYRITITPTGLNVQNYVNLASYAGEESTSLSIYTDSWSASSNKSPYLKGEGIEALYILKQTDWNIPFGNYGIADNNYEAFAQARFTNMGYCEHFSGLYVGRKYFMNNGTLSLNEGQYLGLAVNERTLQIGKGADENSKFQNVVSIPATNSQRTANTSYGNVTAKVDGYYTAIGTIQAGTGGSVVLFYVNGNPVNETKTYRSSTGSEPSFFMISAYVKKGQVLGVGSSTASYFSGLVIIGPDGSN